MSGLGANVREKPKFWRQILELKLETTFGENFIEHREWEIRVLDWESDSVLDKIGSSKLDWSATTMVVTAVTDLVMTV